MVSTGRYASLRYGGCDHCRIFSLVHVYNPTARRPVLGANSVLLGNDLDQILNGIVHGILIFDFVVDIGSIKAPNMQWAPLQGQLLGNIQNDIFGCCSSQGHARSFGEDDAKRIEPTVGWAEIMSPGTQAMCLVNSEQGQSIFFVQLLENLFHSIRLDALRCNVQKDRRGTILRRRRLFGFGTLTTFGKERRHHTFQNVFVLRFSLAAIDTCGWNSFAIERFGLILHECKER